LVITPLCGFVWGTTSQKNGSWGSCLRRLAPSMRTSVLVLHLLSAVLPPFILWTLPSLVPRPWEWVAYSIVFRFCYSPQTFFRSTAFCWAVDDDCHRNQGVRREALHAGLMKFLEEEGRTWATALFLGLGWTGLQMENCDLLCVNRNDPDACVAACGQRTIQRQPQAVATYIQVVLIFVVPAFALLSALHIWRFPIHGKRLKDLQLKQAEAFKDMRHADMGSPSSSSRNEEKPQAPNSSTWRPLVP